MWIVDVSGTQRTTMRSHSCKNRPNLVDLRHQNHPKPGNKNLKTNFKLSSTTSQIYFHFRGVGGNIFSWCSHASALQMPMPCWIWMPRSTIKMPLGSSPSCREAFGTVGSKLVVSTVSKMSWIVLFQPWDIWADYPHMGFQESDSYAVHLS